MSLFELPASKGARAARLAAVLALDLVLAGAGIAMIVSYLDDREAAAARAPQPAVELQPPPPEVETLEPETVDPEEVKRAPTRRARKISKRPRRKTDTSAHTDPPGRGRDPTPDPDPDRDSGRAPIRDPDPGPGPDSGTVPIPGVIDDDPGETERVDFSARQVRRVVDRHTVQLTKCYQHAAKQASPIKPLEGRVDIQFIIMPDGTASSVRAVANTTGSDQLADCVKRLIESWSFPSPGAEEIAFVWPFVFKVP